MIQRINLRMKILEKIFTNIETQNHNFEIVTLQILDFLKKRKKCAYHHKNVLIITFYCLIST